MSDVLELDRPRPDVVVGGGGDRHRDRRDGDLVVLMVSRGVPLAALTLPPIPEIRRVVFNEGRFEDCRLGEKAFVFEAGDDEIAWDPVENRLGSYWGFAWALGQDSLSQDGLGIDRPAPIRRTALDWLRCRRMGLVIIDWNCAARVLAGCIVQAPDHQGAERLRRRLSLPAPTVTVARSVSAEELQRLADAPRRFPR